MSTNTRVTRPANKSTHPGMPDIDDEVMERPIPKPKRTKAQIAADNVVAAEKKAAKAEEVRLNNEKKALLVARIASLEKKMLDDEEQASIEAACPPAKKRILMKVTKSPIKCTNVHLSKCVLD